MALHCRLKGNEMLTSLKPDMLTTTGLTEVVCVCVCKKDHLTTPPLLNYLPCTSKVAPELTLPTSLLAVQLY